MPWATCWLPCTRTTPLPLCWLFKGGTALRKAYFSDYRFSRDLDFTARRELSEDGLRAAVGEVVQAAKQSLGLGGRFEVTWSGRSGASPHPTGQQALRIRVQFPWQPMPMCTLKVEITVDEPVLLPVVHRPLLHGYDEAPDAELMCYSVEEIVAEKLRTPAQAQARPDRGSWGRNCARDYYDLWFALPQADIVVDGGLVASVLSEKCAVRSVHIDSVDDVFPVAVVSEAERQWEASLADLVRPLPPFRKVVEELRGEVASILERR
jgi:predicted nucleotidyltransferase component of viral defense system